MSIVRFENLRYILGDLEGYMHVQGCVHAPEKNMEGPILLLLAQLETLCKHQVKTKADIKFQSVEGTSKHKHTQHLSKILYIYCFKALRNSYCNC